MPPVFRNHGSCKKFLSFIGNTILQPSIMTNHHTIVLPLTVELSKPRLCIYGPYVNLWMRDCPFSLDKLIDVMRYPSRDSYLTKCDDKSGYDHVFATGIPKVFQILVERLVVCLYDFAIWVEGVPLHLP